jgi:hypothetical protein
MFIAECVLQLTGNLDVGSWPISSSMTFMPRFTHIRFLAQNLLGVKEQPQKNTRVWRVSSLTSCCLRNKENPVSGQFIGQ